MLVINLEGILVLTGLHESVGKGGDGRQIIVDGEEFTGQGAGVRKASVFQVSLEQIAKAVGIGIEVGNFPQRFDSGFGVAGLKQIAALHEQRITIARIEREHAPQNFFRAAQRAFGPQGFGRGRENLPGVILFSEADIDFRQADAHVGIFGIHFQNLLDNPDGVFQFTGFQKLIRNLQVLGAGVIEESLLGVKFGQLQHALERRLELADFLVHGDGLDREALSGIGIAYGLEKLGGLVGLAEARVEVADRVGDGEVLGIGLDDFFVFSNGVLNFALLDILLRSAENLLFVEPETERHKVTNSSPWCALTKLALKT